MVLHLTGHRKSLRNFRSGVSDLSHLSFRKLTLKEM